MSAIKIGKMHISDYLTDFICTNCFQCCINPSSAKIFLVLCVFEIFSSNKLEIRDLLTHSFCEIHYFRCFLCLAVVHGVLYEQDQSDYEQLQSCNVWCIPALQCLCRVTVPSWGYFDSNEEVNRQFLSCVIMGHVQNLATVLFLADIMENLSNP